MGLFYLFNVSIFELVVDFIKFWNPRNLSYKELFQDKNLVYSQFCTRIREIFKKKFLKNVVIFPFSNKVTRKRFADENLVEKTDLHRPLN